MERLGTDFAYTVLQSQNAVYVYFTSKQVLPFGFAEQYSKWCSCDFVRTFVISFKKLKLPYHIQYDLVLQIQVGENLNLIAQTSSG